MKRIQGFLLACLVVSMSIIICSCGNTETSIVPESEAESDKIQIGFSMDSFIIERWQRDRDVFVSKAQELGAEVNVQNANGDLEEQISQMEYFIKKKVDVIVVVAIDSDGLTDVVNKAKKAGIKVIAYDRLVKNSNVDLYISFDNEMVGELMAEAMVDKLGKSANIIRICGSPTDNNVPTVISGFDSIIKRTNIEIDRTEYADNWLAETGFNVTNEYLSEGKVPDGIMCGNDSVAGQAIKALAEARLAGQVCVVGQDADLDACQRIVEGTQYMTVYKPVEKLAQAAAEMAVDMANGEETETENTMNDGTYDVPYEKLDPISVTKENMDEVITGKYHQQSDIYLNIPEKGTEETEE